MNSKQYIFEVTKYIRAKDAQNAVEYELQHHLQSAIKAWQEKGYSFEQAEQKAIAAMGSPSQLGKTMNQIHRPKWDWWLMSALLFLFAASLIPIFSIDFDEHYGINMTTYFLENKLFQLLVAFGCIIACIYFDYRILQKRSRLIYVVAISLLMMMAFSPNLIVNGEAMLKFGPIKIVAWTVIPLFFISFSAFFSERQWRGWQLAFIAVIPLLLFMRLPNLPVAIIYLTLLAVLFTFSYMPRHIKRNVWLLVGGMSIVFIGYAIYAFNYLLAPYQTARLAAFLHPERFAQNEGYIILQLREALSHVQLFGAHTIYSIPQAHTDFAFIQLLLSVGYVGGGLVLAAILFISIRIVWQAYNMPFTFGKLLLISACTIYSTQSIYSICMVFGLLPLASFPLPFISYGFTSIFVNSLLIGIALSVYRKKYYLQATPSTRTIKTY